MAKRLQSTLGFAFISLAVLSLWVQSETTLWRLKFFVREALKQVNLASGKDADTKRKRN
jgi:hypothetical protein